MFIGDDLWQARPVVARAEWAGRVIDLKIKLLVPCDIDPRVVVLGSRLRLRHLVDLDDFDLAEVARFAAFEDFLILSHGPLKFKALALVETFDEAAGALQHLIPVFGVDHNVILPVSFVDQIDIQHKYFLLVGGGELESEDLEKYCVIIPSLRLLILKYFL